MSDEIKIGGELIERPVLPIANDDGTPCLYPVVIKSYRKKPGRPNDQGEPTEYYSWCFELISGSYVGATVYGSTNDEARRSYTTKNPMKLLQLMIAAFGVEPEKGTTVKLDEIIGKRLRVELEDKEGGGGETYQQVSRYYAFKGE